MKIQSVEIQSSTSGVALGGTLLLPSGARAAALLLPGSGPQDRDESIGGQKPFLALAKKLGSLRIATLRCDDRGVGDSGGDYLAIDGDSLLADAQEQLIWLSAQCPGLPLTVVGHSQGAYFALRLATSTTLLTTAILLGGPIRPGMDALMGMRKQIAENANLGAEEKAEYLDHSRRLFEIIAAPNSYKEREARVRELITASVHGARDEEMAPDFESVEDYIDFSVDDSLEWEVRDLLLSKPQVLLSQCQVPVLALWGSLDGHLDQELEKAAFDEVKRAFHSSKILPDLNHLFQQSETGAIDNYPEDGDTMLEPIPSMIAEWAIRSH